MKTTTFFKSIILAFISLSMFAISSTAQTTIPSGGYPWAPQLRFSGDSNTGLYRESSDVMSFVANGQKGLTVNGTSGLGRVGIGINNPVARLQVHAGRVEFSGTTDASGSQGGGVLEIANSLRLDGNEIITNTGTALYLQHYNNGDLRVDNNTLMVDASANRVGIGTTSPTQKLDINGTMRATRILLGDKWTLSSNGSLHGSTTYNDEWLRLTSNSNTGFHGGFAAGKLWTRNLLAVMESGADIAKFIHKNDHAFIRVISEAANKTAGIEFRRDDGQNYLITNHGNKLSFTRWHGSEATIFEVRPDKLWAKEICVSTNGNACPDYVFEEDYELKSLNELETYINENKHLPGVKSAKEVEKEGINVTEMTFSLLEKVEELTLYTLDQEKRIKAQADQLKKQKEVIEKFIQSKLKK